MFKSVFGKKLILPLLLLLGACGGGTSTSVPTSAPVPPGISSTGRVTGFGSVYVNGVKFNTSSTTKISNDDVDDGEVIAENDLKVGNVVEVKGTSDDAANANAQSIEMASEVKGPVDNVFNAATKTLVVMGQTILINNNTAIDNNIGPNGLGDLKVGDLVEVHGFRDGTGNIVATRIERQGAVAKFRVRGNISALNGAAKTFKIGNLICIAVVHGSCQHCKWSNKFFFTIPFDAPVKQHGFGDGNFLDALWIGRWRLPFGLPVPNLIYHLFGIKSVMEFKRLQTFPNDFKVGNFSIVAKTDMNSAQRPDSAEINAINPPGKKDAAQTYIFDVRAFCFVEPAVVLDFFENPQRRAVSLCGEL